MNMNKLITPQVTKAFDLPLMAPHLDALFGNAKRYRKSVSLPKRTIRLRCGEDEHLLVFNRISVKIENVVIIIEGEKHRFASRTVFLFETAAGIVQLVAGEDVFKCYEDFRSDEDQALNDEDDEGDEDSEDQYLRHPLALHIRVRFANGQKFHDRKVIYELPNLISEKLMSANAELLMGAPNDDMEFSALATAVTVFVHHFYHGYGDYEVFMGEESETPDFSIHDSPGSSYLLPTEEFRSLR